MTIEQQQELADAGALLERCLTTPLTGKVSWETWIEHIRALPAPHCHRLIGHRPASLCHEQVEGPNSLPSKRVCADHTYRKSKVTQ